MKFTKYTPHWILGFTASDWFIFDFFTKKWAASDGFSRIDFVQDFLYLTQYHINNGIAFGIGVPIILQIVGSILILVLLLSIGLTQIALLKKRKFFASIALGMVIGGGVGNLVERISGKGVVDFIVLGPIPTFNVADVGITVGLTALFATMLLDSRNASSKIH